ncbi:MAG: ROK family protein [Armatimonadetes bacterium]|nr:ROK family protein [Armatimonadota bacterium]
MPGNTIFLGTDSGATTSKIGGIWADGSPISTDLYQTPTPSAEGTLAVVDGWVSGAVRFLERHGLDWEQVGGVGLAIPGPYIRYGVMGSTTNLPKTFENWDFYGEYSAALEAAAGRPIPLVCGNDGNYGAVAEAREVTKDEKGTVIMLAPGSGLGCAYVGVDGAPLEGDTLNGMEASHFAAPVHLLGVRPYPCGCGKTWGCIETYTSIAGLPMLLEDHLPKFPDHPLASSTLESKEKVLQLRDLAQHGDPLACAIFDFQAKALGIHVAMLEMVLDARFVVIGGGLMDPTATTDAFRSNYLEIVRDSCGEYLWTRQRETVKISAAVLGDLSQAIGAALVARQRYS